LDALCRRFNIDNSSRTLHGALLDSEILAEVYLELIGGKQPDFALDTSAAQNKTALKDTSQQHWKAVPRPNSLPSRVSEKEKAAHAAFIEKLGESSIWSKWTN
jgi:DNA polymerase-3 subunit epsilon